METLVNEEFDQLKGLHSRMARLEYEADLIKHDIRGFITRRIFLPVDRLDLINFLEHQENIADYAQDFSVILTLRNTAIHNDLQYPFFEYLKQVFQVSGTLLTAAVKFKHLAEESFSGAEARSVLEFIEGLGEEEWKADKMSRKLSRMVYELEGQESIINIIFYEKMIVKLGDIANQAESAGDYLRVMIEKG